VPACGGLADEHPRAKIALRVVAISHGDHSGLELDPHRMIVARRDHGALFAHKVGCYRTIAAQQDAGVGGVLIKIAGHGAGRRPLNKAVAFLSHGY
jgi:hypothetical protein